MTYPSGGKAPAFNALACAIALECDGPVVSVGDGDATSSVAFDGYSEFAKARLTLVRERYPNGWTERVLVAMPGAPEGHRPVDFLWRRSHDHENARARISHLFAPPGSTAADPGAAFLDDAFLQLATAMESRHRELALAFMGGRAPPRADRPRSVHEITRVV